MSVRKTSIVIDEDLLEEAQDVLQTQTICETINEALRKVLRGDARRKEVESLRSMDGNELNNEDVMKDAWRQ